MAQSYHSLQLLWFDLGFSSRSGGGGSNGMVQNSPKLTARTCVERPGFKRKLIKKPTPVFSGAFAVSFREGIFWGCP